MHDQKPLHGWRPRFGVPFFPELNFEKQVLRNLRRHLEAIRDGAGPDMDLLVDLNFNAKTEGYLKILRAIAVIDMFWIEIDSYDPDALGYIRRQSPHPISSCEPSWVCASSCPISARNRWMSRLSTRCGMGYGNR